MSDELMPCPFCRSNDIQDESDIGTFGKYYFIECNDCECEGPKESTFEEAIKKWNTRNSVQYKHTPEPEG